MPSEETTDVKIEPGTPGAAPDAPPQDPGPAPGAPETGPPPGGMLFRYRNAMGVGVAILLVACPWGRLPATPLLLTVGGLLALAGVTLRLWCILQIGGSARKTSKLKAERVISWGPYSLVRNPIYIANTTTFLGFTVLAGLPWLAPVVLGLFWLWYDAIVRREEAFIGAKHPHDFAAYAAAVRRWLPGLRYRGRPADIAPYPFLRALKRERGHLIAVGTGVALVILLRLLWA